MPVDKETDFESDSRQNLQFIRKRRLPGACDACRTKKIKCDSAVKPDKVCTNCTLFNTPCTHIAPRRQKEKEIKEMTAAYIETLEQRIKKLEAYIQKIHPGENIDHVIEVHGHDRSTRSPSLSVGISNAPVFLSTDATSLRPPGSREDSNLATADGSDQSEQENIDLAALTEKLKMFATTTTAVDERFFGQSSTFMFAKQIADSLKLAGRPVPGPDEYKRSIYWDLEPWELSYVSSSEARYVYPEPDLLDSLVLLYFERSNTIIPVLHRPTFMKSLALGQHNWDTLFGMTVLLVCALGSKYSRDPRVILGNDSTQTGLSAGWHYFSQVQVYRNGMLYKSTTYDLQYYALAAMYMCGTSIPQAAWTLLGIGLRHAFEKGVHHRKGSGYVPSAEYELQKRAFWALICLDCAESSFVGRFWSMPLETYDLEYPIECDDEYWDTGNPETSFRQPEGKPCSITAFVSFIKLCEILGFVVKTVSSNKKSRHLSGFIGPEWEGKMVAELDSAMNKWKEALPEYLNWDPERRDETVFHQPYLTKATSFTRSSLAMCKNAARVCSRILEAATQRGIRVLPIALTSAFTSAMVVTLSLWGCRPAGYLDNSAEDMDNLSKCIAYLKACEDRWHGAGRLLDILAEAGGLHRFGPMITSHIPSLQPVPGYPAPVVSTAFQGYSSNVGPATLHQETSNICPDLSTDEWNLRKLLLTEMGYLPAESNDSNPSVSGIGISMPEAYDAYAVHPNIEVPLMSAVAQQDCSAQDTDLSVLWSEIPTPFTSPEEWDVYYHTHISQ